jgi:hypothetical protein
MLLSLLVGTTMNTSRAFCGVFYQVSARLFEFAITHLRVLHICITVVDYYRERHHTRILSQACHVSPQPGHEARARWSWSSTIRHLSLFLRHAQMKKVLDFSPLVSMDLVEP